MLPGKSTKGFGALRQESYRLREPIISSGKRCSQPLEMYSRAALGWLVVRLIIER